MVLWKQVGKAFSVAAIGLAVSGIAVGQVAGPGLGNGSVDPDAKIDAESTAKAAAAADVNATSNVDKTRGTQTDEIRSGIDATAQTNRQNINSDAQSNINAVRRQLEVRFSDN